MSDLFAFNLFFELGVLHLQVTFHAVKDYVHRTHILRVTYPPKMKKDEMLFTLNLGSNKINILKFYEMNFFLQ
jgi:hypothetical protein